ncbi:MAG: energy transducer TonB, partial [Burkholderiales bacterium]
MPARTSAAIPALQRKLIAAGGVVLLHAGALWALQSGLLHRPAAVFVPVQIVTEIITPPVARAAPPVARPEPPPPPRKPT